MFATVIMCAEFDKSLTGFQQLNTYDLSGSEYDFTATFGLDGFSLVFLVLTLFIFPLCFLAAQDITEKRPAFLLLLALMEFLLVLTFSTIDLF